MAARVDYLVVGAGIVGLAIAKALLESKPGHTVMIVDKEDDVALHASGRNSGVLHAGFYYAPDSLKARLTRDGNQILRRFCAEEGVPVRASGKVVVAKNEGELASLDELFRRGVANGVDLEMVDVGGLRRLEPLAATYRRALWSPTTAVADPAQAVRALATYVTRQGAVIRLGTEASSAGPGWVRTSANETIYCGHMINSAGLYADKLAHAFGVGTDYRVLPFKGLYWYGSWPKGRLSTHVYPVPDSRNPFLGVHLTVTVDGRTKIGPTAIPALWREDYGGLGGFQVRELAEIAKTYPSFASSKSHDVLGLMRTELPKYVRSHLVKQAASLVPSVRPADFTTRGKVGVRAQLFHLPTRKLEMDFVIRSGPRSTHVLNAVSPAWTSSLAFGQYIVDHYVMESD